MKKDIVKLLNEHEGKLRELDTTVDSLLKEYSRKSEKNENDPETTKDFKAGFDLCRLVFVQELKKIKEQIPKV